MPKPVKLSAADLAKQLSLPALPAPKAPASAGQQQGAADDLDRQGDEGGQDRADAAADDLHHARPATSTTSAPAPLVKERLFANPSRPGSYAAGGQLQLRDSKAQITSFQNYFSDVLHLGKNQYTLQPLKAGAIVVAGTILGRIGGAHRQPGLAHAVHDPASRARALR